MEQAQQVQEILLTLGLGILLIFVTVILVLVGSVAMGYADTIKKRLASVDKLMVPFGQSATGHYVHGQAVELYGRIDEADDEIVGQISSRLNALVNRELVTRDQVSEIMRMVVGGVLDLTDGQPTEPDIVRDSPTSLSPF